MGIHRSLVLKSRLKRPRSVLTRAERLEILKETGRWKDGSSVFGLPKVRTVQAKAKKKKKEKAAADGTAAAPAAGATPAAGAAPAAGGKAAAAPAAKKEEKKK